MPRFLVPLVLLTLTACATTTPRTELTPRADHHQHLFSPDLAALLSSGETKFEPLAADELIRMLDDAKIERAVVLSTAYLYGSASRSLPDEYERTRAMNDWVAAEAAKYPKRLVAFCGFNPLKPYAIAELERCAAAPLRMRGIKLHMGNGDVQLQDPAHVEQLQRVFRAANAHGMSIAIHLRASISRKRPYGAEQSKIFLEQVLPAAPDVTVQVAHLAASGPGYGDAPGEEAVGPFADAFRRRDPRVRNLVLDVSGIAHPEMPAAEAARFVQRIREVGVEHLVYGSDSARGGNPPPKETWEAFRALPLTDDELARIIRNVAPYLR